MVRLSLTLLCLTLIFGLCGCQEQEKSQDKPIWEDTKMSDLVSTNSGRIMSIREATFEVYVVEISAGDKKTIGDIQKLLYDKPININNPQAFAKNNFVVGFNQIRIMDRLNEIFSETARRRLKNISILIPADQQNQIFAKRIFKKQNIYYTSEDDATEAIIAGPGDIILELKVRVIETRRGVCRLYVQPAFLPPLANTITELAQHQDNKKFDFPAVGFNVNMSQGDLIILTPVEYLDHQSSLGSLFFCYNKPAGVQRIYVIICSRVNF